ncbi:MAG: helix-turn-helix transcriptional regulator [Candidatus Levybacteria bacterium]|nr:helix-turn-helix transcriptional regulator [Candidatus Levybacteria bacterium]
MSEKVTNHLQECRVEKNITQEKLAKSIGVTRQTIIAIEKGNYTPSVLLALKIAKYFDTTVEKLFTIEK